MKYKLVIFDMDGTILNTLEDLADSLNAALRQNGMPVRTLQEVRNFVGNGIAKLIERGVPEGTSEADRAQVLSDFNDCYAIHCKDKTRPYEGTPRLIQSLKEAGVYTAVVSNKADYGVQALVRQYFDGLFDVAIGERPPLRRKPAPDMVEEVLSRLGISAREAVYIGDSDVDIATARNSGMDCICVDWGFRDPQFQREHGAKIIVSAPEEIYQLVTEGRSFKA